MVRAALLVLAADGLLGCGPRVAPGVHYAATIHPLAAILRELTASRAETLRLAPPGASPHLYEILPSDARLAESAEILFYVAESLDGWAARLPAKRSISLLDLLPASHRREWEGEEAHGHDSALVDPHFWADPQAVLALVPAITETLCTADPGGAAIYGENATRFSAQLRQLDTDMSSLFDAYEGRSLALFHPSWLYFFERYGLKAGAIVEASPGKESSPRHIQELVELMKREDIRAVLSEPQLAKAPAEALAEAAGMPLLELDPLGGRPGWDTYEEIIRGNAGVLLKALE